MTATARLPRAAALLAASAVALLVAAPLALAPAPSARAAGDDDVTWTVRTASNDYGADRTSFGYTIAPGAAVDDALVVTNKGDETLDLGVYAADGYTTESGQFDILAAGEESKYVGAWASAGADRVEVAPGQTVEVPFTVDVPANASPGDYVGGIVTSLVQPDDQQGINVDRRLGVRVAIRVSGDLAPGLAIENGGVSYSGGWNPFAAGDATVSYTLHNTGNAVLSADQTVSLAGPFGLFPATIGEVDAPPALLPGESWTVSVTAHDVPAVFALFGTVTVTPLVTDAAGSTSPIADVTATVAGPAMPWTLLVIIALLVVAIVFGLRWRRRRAVALKDREAARVAAAVEEALAERDAVGATQD